MSGATGVLEEVLTFPVFSPRSAQEEKRESSLGGQGSSPKQSCPERGYFLMWLWQIQHHPTQAANGRVLCVHRRGEVISVFLKLSSKCALCVLDCLLNEAVNYSKSKLISFPVPSIWHRQV